MSRVGADVCYWEFRVNLTAFKLNNPTVPLNWTFINLVIHNRFNLTTHQLNGFSDKNASNLSTNSNLSTTYKYPLSNSSSVFLIAFPPSSTTSGTFLNFTFNLSTNYFEVNAAVFEGIPDFVQEGYWPFVYVFFSLFLAGFLMVSLCIQLKNYDPYSEFEIRRDQVQRQKRRERREAELFSLQPTQENDANKSVIAPSKSKEPKKKESKKAVAEIEMSR